MQQFQHLELLAEVSAEYQSQKIAWVLNNEKGTSLERISSQSGTYWEEW
jgi:hypothetical protein